MKSGKVYIKRVKGKKALQLAWLDPATGRERRKSAKSNRQRDASKQADALERQLFRGVPIGGLSWDEFCERYKTEYVATLKKKSRGDWPTVKAAIDAELNPQTLQAVGPSAISTFTASLRTLGKSEGTIARYLRTLRSALKWAEQLRLIDEAPYISLPRRARKPKAMKGRPITLEEFERMIANVGKVVEADHVDSWKHTLWVYWLSGIRLDEATELYWDRPDKLCIHGIDRKRPLLLIHQELEKGGEDRTYPLTPDFVKHLRKTPPAERTGRVCRPLTADGVTSSYITISRKISEIGKKAGVKVSATKYASAHDLRRSFGTRWAPLVQPPVLQQLMRHKSLSTTMAYYVELRASETADILWAAHETGTGDLLGDPKPKTGRKKKQRRAVN